MSTINNSRIPSLDGLRTISILMVIVSHASFFYGYKGILNIGDLGVRIFFVISGFLITGLLMKESDATGEISLVRFYIRRTLRIFPPYYFFLLVIILFSVAGKVDITFDQFLPAVTYTSNYFYPGEWILDHAWSLSVEEQFYLVYPGLLTMVGRRVTEWMLAASLVVCPILRLIDFRTFGASQPIWLTKGFHANLDTLAIGCLLAFKYKSLHNNAFYLRLIRSKAMWLVPVLVFVIHCQIDYQGLDLGILFSINNVLIALMIDWAVTNYDNVSGKILNSRPFVFVGMMSYSIYIWQQPFLDPDPPTRFFAFPYSIVGFVLFCSFSYFVVEKLSIRLRKIVEIRFLGRSPTRIPAVPAVAVD